MPAAVLLSLVCALCVSAQYRPATGPLRLLKSNPRYFTDGEPKGVAYAQPHPWMRTGPGIAADEKAKCDQTRFDPEYFGRMRQHIQAAGARGLEYYMLPPGAMANRELFDNIWVPHGALASTGYFLARPGSEYVVFQPGGHGESSVNLSDGAGAFAVEWLDVNADKTSNRIFRTPFPGPAVLHLRSIGALH